MPLVKVTKARMLNVDAKQLLLVLFIFFLSRKFRSSDIAVLCLNAFQGWTTQEKQLAWTERYRTMFYWSLEQNTEVLLIKGTVIQLIYCAYLEDRHAINGETALS